jgi:signal transduction histidine kinase
MKLLFAGTLCAVMVCLTSCANSGVYPSISSISVSWLNLKSDIINSKQADELQGNIEDFHLTLKQFLSSPIIYLYRIQRPENIQLLADIDSAVDSLNSALKEGGLPVFPIILEIDSNLEQLQLIEKSLSETSQLQYFQLFFFFCVLIISIVLIFWALYSRLEKAEKREKQSLAFSRETILAQERERSRIARELHDTVAQDLWRLSFQAESIDKADESEQRSKLCAEVVKGQKEVMQRVRSICDNLIPPDFQRRRFDDALRNLCYNFEQRTGIECQLVIQDNLPPDDTQPIPQGRGSPLDTQPSSQERGSPLDTQLQSFRIVQECLTNIEKHAEASKASVIVRSNKEGELLMCVSDNGKGFSPPDRDSLRSDGGHYGLWNIYERAASISAAVTVDSEEGEGTTITLRIPFKTELK